jgi:hypothetical protein
MAASDLTSVAFIYKRKYTDKATGDLAMRDHPLYSMVSKEDGFTGSAFFYPIRYGNPQGVSAAFSSAQSGASSSKGLQLQASRKAKYGVITLNGEAMAACSDKGAFLDLVTQETDGVLAEVGDSLAFDLYRDGNGNRGRRSSASTNVITLTTADDARNFKVGMTVVASSGATGASLRTGSTTVAAVDEDAGTVTLTSAAGITSFADNDYLFRIGDPNGVCMEGLAALFPLTAPVLSSDSFRGIDRGVDPRRLAGVRIDDTATSIEENIGLVAVKIAQVGKKADVCFLNPIKFWEVARRLNAKVEYDGAGGSADFGFEFLKVHSPAGAVKIYSDPDCPTNRGYVGKLSTLYIKHLRGLPHIVSDDGNPSLRSTSADDIEARVRCWSNLVCTEPGCWGVFSI